MFADKDAASATMVTAILPSLTDESSPPTPDLDPRTATHNPRDSVALSVESEATITPERYYVRSSQSSSQHSQPSVGAPAAEAESAAGGKHKPSALAGYVGLFTGCGALVALSVFLPLPARFGRLEGVTMGQAVTYSFYVVGVIALLVAGFVAFGLRHLRGEEGKGWRLLLGLRRVDPDGTGAEVEARPKKVKSMLLQSSYTASC